MNCFFLSSIDYEPGKTLSDASSPDYLDQARIAATPHIRITCTFAGVLAPFGIIDWFPGPEFDNASFFTILTLIPGAYFGLITETLGLLMRPEVIAYGLKFSVSLLFIVVAHEAGHYIACRIYKVDATLPYFIPTPPLLGPAGTLGAFIRIVSPMPSRKAVFDIGVAGPLAGFVALIPVSLLMILTLKAGAYCSNSGGLWTVSLF